MKIIKIICFAVQIAFTANAQVPINGLVAWYPYNGNANDESGNGFNGAVVGATLATDRFGDTAKAYSFDGISDYIVSVITTLPSVNTCRSVSCWFKTVGTSEYMMVTGYGNGGFVDTDFPQLLKSNGKAYFHSGCHWNELFSHDTLNDNEWHHYVTTYDGYLVRLYIDGIRQDSSSIIVLNTFHSTFQTGRCNFTENSYFPGLIDDVGIWNRALTQAEITGLYNAVPCYATVPVAPNVSRIGPGTVTLTASGGTEYRWYTSHTGGDMLGTGATFVTPYLEFSTNFWVSNFNICESRRVPVRVMILSGIVPDDMTVCAGDSVVLQISAVFPDKGLVASYPFNGNAQDESGHGNHGTVTGAVLVPDRSGNPNSAYYFDGSGDFIYIPPSSTLDLRDSLTIALWLKPFRLVDLGMLAIWRGDLQGEYDPYKLLFWYDKVFFVRDVYGPNGVEVWTPMANFHSEQYNFIICRYDITSGLMELRLNEEVFVQLQTYATFSYNTSQMWNIIGAVDMGSYRFFKGNIDDIRIYNRSLSPAECYALYLGEPPSQMLSYVWSTGDTASSVTVAPTQTTTYTVTITNGNNVYTDSVKITVEGSSITGKLTYDNEFQTPLSCSVIYLENDTGAVVDSTFTDLYGNYRFCNLPDGSYHVSVKTQIPWGGVNSADALLISKHFVGISALTGLALQAADVNLVFGINATDAFLVLKRFVEQVDSFPAGDWIFEGGDVVISGGSAHVMNFKGLCVGEVGRSYIPPVCNFMNCGDILTDLRDGQQYPTVQIGTQCWMQRNLNIGNMISGTNQTNNNIIEKFCYNNDLTKCIEYGGMYQWNEMMQYDSTPGIQGICPSGWHLPADYEWCLLLNYLDSTANCDSLGWMGITAGGKMKVTGLTYWTLPNTGATNESGFSALGAGWSTGFSFFTSIHESTLFWSSSLYSNTLGIHFWLVNDHSDIYRQHTPLNTYGDYVRCVRD